MGEPRYICKCDYTYEVVCVYIPRVWTSMHFKREKTLGHAFVLLLSFCPLDLRTRGLRLLHCHASSNAAASLRYRGQRLHRERQSERDRRTKRGRSPASLSLRETGDVLTATTYQKKKKDAYLSVSFSLDPHQYTWKVFFLR